MKFLKTIFCISIFVYIYIWLYNSNKWLTINIVLLDFDQSPNNYPKTTGHVFELCPHVFVGDAFLGLDRSEFH